MNFQKGDLLICVANDVENPQWEGILPEIGQYYTWRGDNPHFPEHFGFVEEIISPTYADGLEYSHAKAWYKKVDDNVNIEELMEETQLETA